MNQQESQNVIADIQKNIAAVIVGKEGIIQYLMTAMIAGGHVLLEDVPGTGKTKMAKSLARSIDAKFNRIQFTPDLLPSDITGLNIFNQKEGEFLFHEGPVFCNILLADEINRATPRTQSSLLECMEERQVTVDGVTRKLEEPFFVIATQNPIETAGTFPLPEAQLDRFFMQLSMGLPTAEEEQQIMNRFLRNDPLTDLQPVCTGGTLRDLQQSYQEIFIHPLLIEYIQKISAATRNASEVAFGVSPRGTLALLRASQAFALVNGREHVIPEDIKELAVSVLAHRLVLHGGVSGTAQNRRVMEKLLDQVPVPTERWEK